jgi:hypothetical protein
MDPAGKSFDAAEKGAWKRTSEHHVPAGKEE